MLTQLHIENIAVIEQADIDFSQGLSVLSGETGAGKSIIIDSLNAVLGNRMSKDLIRRGAETALVTAVFETEQANAWLEGNDIDPASELILQRKITKEGKSSCKICGVPVTAAQLRQLASQLVDIHGQNDGLCLLDEKRHIFYLDNYGEYFSCLEDYKAEYSRYKEIKSEIRKLSMDEEEKEHLTESLQRKVSELESAELRIGEYDEICARRDLLRNSEKLTESLNEVMQNLDNGESGACSELQNALYFAKRASSYSREIEDAVQSLKDASFAASNAYEIVNSFLEDLDFSDEEYDRLESRISRLDRLSKKYSRDESGLIDLLEESKHKLGELEYSGDRLDKLEKQLQVQEKVCREKALKLTLARKEAALSLEKRITHELRDLNMPSIRFQVKIDPCQDRPGFSALGADEVSFLMSANAGEEPGKISKIASGGELSRIMLALKNVFAEKDPTETMIFDEIDTGVSGISAQRVAEKLFSVSKGKQVMCISHLPQIAAMADQQYLVSKSERDGRTYTEVTKLSFDGRKKEIARMYGGDHITETTLQAAEEQLLSAESFRKDSKK